MQFQGLGIGQALLAGNDIVDLKRKVSHGALFQKSMNTAGGIKLRVDLKAGSALAGVESVRYKRIRLGGPYFGVATVLGFSRKSFSSFSICR